jgi:hypothetical protein
MSIKITDTAVSVIFIDIKPWDCRKLHPRLPGRMYRKQLFNTGFHGGAPLYPNFPAHYKAVFLK